MLKVLLGITAALGLFLTGCPEDSCFGNNDCIDGYACTKDGNCIEIDALQIDTESLPDAVVNETYQTTLQASGGIPPYTWTLETTEAWPGIQSSTGVISGDPQTVQAGITLTVSVIDNSYDGLTAQRSYTIDVVTCSDSQQPPCSAHGTCDNGNCQCDTGYTGDQCTDCENDYYESNGECLEWQYCPDVDPCSGHGTCDHSSGQPVCTCQTGYQGPTCGLCEDGYHFEGDICAEDEVCEAGSCNEHGDCDDSTGRINCSCHEGYAGTRCQDCAGGYHLVVDACIEDDTCELNSCNQHGDCDDSSGSIVCSCHEGYTGAHCELCDLGYHQWEDSCCLVGTCSIVRLALPNPQASDHFGCSVAISGDYIIVGAEGVDGKGAAYVYHRIGDNQWDNGTRLYTQEIAAEDGFGISADIDGDYAIVGAWPGQKVIVFHRIGLNSWDSGTKLDTPEPQSHGGYGWSVAISGEYAVVGSTYMDDGVGGAFLFRRTNTTTWDSGVKLDPGTGETAFLGYSVAIDIDYLAVSNVGPDGAFIFHRTGLGLWTEVSNALFAGLPPGNFGYPVAINGDNLVVGASGYAPEGAAYIFNRTGTNTWELAAELDAFDAQSGDQFGFDVAVSGSHAIIGAKNEDELGSGAGAAYIFSLSESGEWIAGVKLIATIENNARSFGESLGMDNGYIVVGAAMTPIGEVDSIAGAGTAYIFY